MRASTALLLKLYFNKQNTLIKSPSYKNYANKVKLASSSAENAGHLNEVKCLHSIQTSAHVTKT